MFYHYAAHFISFQVSSSPSNFVKIFFDDGETVFETAALVNEEITLV